MPIGINKVSRNSQIGSEIPDSFENQDLAEWTSTSDFATTTTRAFDGSVSAECTNGGTHSNMWWDAEVVSASNQKTASGYFYYDENNPEAGVTAVNSNGQGYAVYIRLNNGEELRLYEISENAVDNVINTTANFNLSSGNWYKLLLNHDGTDSFTISILDTNGTALDSLSESDSNHDPDRFGIHSFASGTLFDLVGMS